MGAYTDFTIDQGTDFSTTIDLAADDGTAINIAGFVFNGQIRKSYTSANATANLFIVSTDAPNGAAIMVLTSDVTANIAFGRYVYDVTARDISNNTTRILEGIITITPRVTR